MEIKIRSEKVTDYADIANVTYRAFLGWHPDNQYVSETVLVDLLRHNSGFNPELSLVAETGSKIVGHVMFSPYKFIVRGSETMGAVLAPISVQPEYQRLGIGKKLIEEGHDRLKELGYTFSLLCGHDTYYPRFGYKTRMFSEQGTKVSICTGKAGPSSYELRPVFHKDLPWIIERWHNRHKTDQLALFPGFNISEWCNLGVGSRCSVIVRDKKDIGFIRFDNSNFNVRELLTDDENVCDILAYLTYKKHGGAEGEIHTLLPYEYLQPLCKKSQQIRVEDMRTAYTAFMIKVLSKDSFIGDYCERVEAGTDKPGIVVFPSMFDIDDGRVD